MSKVEKQTGQEVVLPAGGESEENLPLFPTPTAEPEQEAFFDWANDPSIVLKAQPAIAVYVNRRGDVVVRQEGDDPYEGDEFVFIRPENLEQLLKGMRGVKRDE